MDLGSFLALEKRRLAEERQHLYELNSSSMTRDHKNSPSAKANEDNNINKNTKDWINQQQNNRKTDDDVSPTTGINRKKKNQDDMEQWVTDTFYSYFPGFSNEYQRRQNELQKRQLENQENLIRHQMLHADQYRKNKTVNIDSARSNNSSLISNGNNGAGEPHGTYKTDMEIINVNNPNYVPSKHSGQSVRPDSARYKLLQDLRHTNLTNLLNSSAEDAREVHRREAEIESARKKEYQRELMQQIEEKRRTIKLLRDKEQQQEEVLTRRLQEQLRTMKLEEQLEKERIKAVKVRFDAEQNRLTREHLLAKLENGSQRLLDSNQNKIDNEGLIDQSSELIKKDMVNKQDNKVYKYFSNSEKHEYNYRNRSSSVPSEIDLEIDHPGLGKVERECYHLSEKICPMCNEPLKELENFCLRCQNKISFRIKSPLPENNKRKQTDATKFKSNEEQNSKAQENESEKSFFLVCTRCERLYSWCRTCTSKTDVCKACQNKRNLCMSCRKTLCSFCLEEVACGKDTETLHINDSGASFENEKTKQNESANKMSFHVMQDNRDSIQKDNKSSNAKTSLSPIYTSLNNLNLNPPPYSVNIDKNSIFHPNHKPLSLFPTSNEDEHLNISKEHELGFYDLDYLVKRNEKDIDRLRRDTDKRLFRYLKNYGDLAHHTRGTQTTPKSSGRRDIVLPGEHSLSIPLLREMPKMTRNETNKLKKNSKELEDLERRWDIPAVQKYTISSESPKVVTQVGAIRKQLQVDRLFSESGDS